MITDGGGSIATSEPSVPQLLEGESIKPIPSGAVLVWAALGVAWLTYIVIGGTWWVTSSDHFGPQPSGADEISDLNLIFIRGFEFLSVTLTLGFVWQYLVRPWRTGKGLTRDGMLVLGTSFAYFIDPTVNLFSYTFAWNAHALNIGSWEEVFPGLIGGSRHFGEGIAWALPQYIYFGLGGALIGCWVFAKIQERRPNITKPQFFVGYIAAFFVFDTILEYACIRFELYSYARTWSPLTIGDGSQYQWPLYEGLTSTAWSLGFVYLRLCWMEGRSSFVDRGIERLGYAGRKATITLTLAIIGFSAVWAWLAWFWPWAFQSIFADSVSDLPSYLRPGP